MSSTDQRGMMTAQYVLANVRPRAGVDLTLASNRQPRPGLLPVARMLRMLNVYLGRPGPFPGVNAVQESATRPAPIEAETLRPVHSLALPETIHHRE
jgi:hypothetical protein